MLTKDTGHAVWLQTRLIQTRLENKCCQSLLLHERRKLQIKDLKGKYIIKIFLKDQTYLCVPSNFHLLLLLFLGDSPTHCHPVLKREEVIFHFDRKQMFALHWRDAVESKIVVFHKHWTKLNVNGHALECNSNIKIYFNQTPETASWHEKSQKCDVTLTKLGPRCVCVLNDTLV